MWPVGTPMIGAQGYGIPPQLASRGLRRHRGGRWWAAGFPEALKGPIQSTAHQPPLALKGGAETSQ